MSTKVMDPQPDCFVSGALAAVLRISRLAGIAPLRFVKKKTGWRVSLSPGFSIYGYFIVTIIILVNTGTLISELLMDQDKSVRMRSNTRRIVWIVDSSIMMLIAGTAAYGAPSRMRSMISCLNQVQKMNLELNIHHWSSHSEKKKTGLFFFWIIITIILTVVDHVLLTVTIYLINAETWVSLMYSLYYCCYWILQLCEMQFVMITLHVQYSFKAVNDSLMNLLDELSDFKQLPLIVPFNSIMFKVDKIPKRRSNNYVSSMIILGEMGQDNTMKSTRLPHEAVRRLVLVYSSISDVVRDVDQSHGLIVLMMLCSFLLHLVCTPYYLINNLFSDSFHQNSTIYAINVVVQLFWCFYHTINLLMVIEPCHMTHAEMKVTRELVSHLMRCAYSIYDPLAVELELFFKHLVLNNVSYSPLKVTTMSRTLMATILGSITTYLVVIIQL